MPTVNLRTPILAEQLRAVNFFNGRLVSGEDMTDEQNAHRAVHELLGESIGDGIVNGLEVRSEVGGTAAAPIVSVNAGLAINRAGQVLILPGDTSVRLVRPPAETTPVDANEVFHTCTPPQETSPLVDAAVYLLTICSSRRGEGSTPFSGMDGVHTRCGMRWIVDSVEFRLINLNVSADLQSVPDRLRNRVAYACFGSDVRNEFGINPFGAPRTPATLLDALRGTALTDCDVPLAVVQWKTTGVVYVDLWSVRRRCRSGTAAPGQIAFSDRAAAQAEAMYFQFSQQLSELGRSPDAGSIEARQFFRYLPAAGFLPVSSGAVPRFDYPTFFTGKTCSPPRYIESADVEALLAESMHYPPVDLDDPEFVRIYFVHENRAIPQFTLPVFNDFPDFSTDFVLIDAVQPSPIDVASSALLNVAELARFDASRLSGVAVAPAVVGRPNLSFSPTPQFAVPLYVVFANANVPFFANSRFDRSHFDFANFV